MRVATWNVNSLKARLEKVTWWLERAKPDVLLIQETKLKDTDVPTDVFRDAGYVIAHHGEGAWNGVAIASRSAIENVVTNFGEPLRPAKTPDVGVGGPAIRHQGVVPPVARPVGPTLRDGDDEPLAEARMMSAEIGGVRIVCVYAPNGRVVGSPFYEAKLVWFDRLAGWLEQVLATDMPLVIGGDFNVAPEDVDVWDPRACHGGTHVSEPERKAFARLGRGALIDAYRLSHPEPERYTWWDYRAGNFHKNFGMRIDHLLVSASLKPRIVWAEIDREARKGKPIPSDHAPLVIDIDAPGHPFDAGWTSAEKRIAGRRTRPS